MKRLAALILLCAASCGHPAFAKDGPQWAQLNDPETSAWFERQKMPDSPRQSCCGEADAYYADSVEVRDGKFFAIVTDERDDAPLDRPHVPIGTRVEIPSHKFNDPRNDLNPTLHGIVFLNVLGEPLCYFNPPGDG